jgi:CRISPR/Cas system CMR-associated protein Cmr3 (group 5 of RAMP superfamily)
MIFLFLFVTRQAFDDSGDRINAEYDVINIGKKKEMKIVGSFFYENVSQLHLLRPYYSLHRTHSLTLFEQT